MVGEERPRVMEFDHLKGSSEYSYSSFNDTASTAASDSPVLARGAQFKRPTSPSNASTSDLSQDLEGVTLSNDETSMNGGQGESAASAAIEDQDFDGMLDAQDRDLPPHACSYVLRCSRGTSTHT